jgi:hypothetical protein
MKPRTTDTTCAPRWRNYTYYVSLGKALKMDRSKSEAAAKAEISQLIS